jgi:8-oxo-dGTP diphosphatase
MINVTCAIIQNEDKILVAQRNNHMDLPLKWEFPGGKVENGESEESCLIRELKEELNIDIQLLCRLTPRIYEYEKFTIRLIPFISKYLSGEIILAEHKKVLWMKENELRSLDWAAADIPILEDYLKLNYDPGPL